MKIEQIYTGCLAQGAYYIESNGEVAIIDPLREITPYTERAKKDDAKIKYIFETHFHADFVSGHITLSKETGAKIVYGPNANTSFDSVIAKDGECFQLGDIHIVAIHTPGHTMESTTYLLKDSTGRDHAVFSGDTLFLGDVGRPDLAQGGSLTKEGLAGILYDSLRTKIMVLEDDVIVYPAHGAGSACGKNMSKETVGTIGEQKKTNYALNPNLSKEQFIKEVTSDLLPPPQYFPSNVKMNREGYDDIDSVIERGKKALSPTAFEKTANETGALILDVRNQQDFCLAHVPNSIFIGLDGGFAPWVGTLIKDVKQSFLIIAPKGREEEAIIRLSRVGFDNTLGYLDNGIESWEKEGKEVGNITTIKAASLLENEINTFDVRKNTEYTDGHLEKAINTPLDFINDYFEKFPTKETFGIYCAGGYRSVIAASILKGRGIHNLYNIEGGFAEIKKTGLRIN